MQSQSKSIKSLTLEADVNEKDLFQIEKHSKLKLKVLMLADGRCYVRYEQLDLPHRLVETIILRDDKWDELDHKSKSLTRTPLTDNFTREDLVNLGGFCFPVLPLFGVHEADIKKQFSMSLVQSDKDYTWIKFVPTSEKARRDIVVAQIGVINYQNAISPANFPLYVVWREPGSREIAWRVTKVSINDNDSVRESDFGIEIREYERNGWRIQRSDGIAKMKAFWKYFNKE